MMKLPRRFLPAFLVAMGLLGAPAFAGPGVATLATKTLTTAVTAEVQSAVSNLSGMSGLTVEASFTYGSGGTTAAVVVQTSMDGGTVWRDVAYFAFTTATAVKYANVSGLTPKVAAAYAALAADGINDGLLGDRLRAVITSTGTYVGTTLAVRASVR